MTASPCFKWLHLFDFTALSYNITSQARPSWTDTAAKARQ